MNSDLQDFVKEALVQIVKGIADAQNEIKQCGAIVNPVLAQKKATGDEDIFRRGYRLDKDNLRSAGILETQNGGIADIVEFDVAITTSKVNAEGEQSSSKKDAGFRLKVVSAGVDFGSGESKSQEITDSQVSHLKFKIPVLFPQGPV